MKYISMLGRLIILQKRGGGLESAAGQISVAVVVLWLCTKVSRCRMHHQSERSDTLYQKDQEMQLVLNITRGFLPRIGKNRERERWMLMWK